MHSVLLYEGHRLAGPPSSVISLGGTPSLPKGGSGPRQSPADELSWLDSTFLEEVGKFDFLSSFSLYEE